MIVILTGGTGGAKLVQGLSLEIDPKELIIVCNTGDDFITYGLHVSPDLDTITYTLAGIHDPSKGWGIKDDTFTVLEWLGKYGGETWFRLGDRDLATHIRRSALMRQGRSLSQVTARIRKSLGIEAVILPMSDDRVETRVITPRGEISFQDFFVKTRCADEVEAVLFAGVENSRPAPGVIEAIREANGVILCPSNPVTSIGPILAVPGVRTALRESRAPVIGVSPIIGGAPVSGPAHKLMAAMGMEVSALGVAKAYADFLSTLLIATEDGNLAGGIRELGINSSATSIRLDSIMDRRRVAHEVLALL
ncbi:MAG: 2-phospho-L-lactate transferase [Deltaproteobacteria bacterium]|nr:2-phospho-L-lactate transferase [Deltaproteobacteria bacterium]